MSPVYRKIALYTDPAFNSSAGLEAYTKELIEGIYKRGLQERFVFFGTREFTLKAKGAEIKTLRSTILNGQLRRVLRFTWALSGWPSAETLIGQDLALVHSPSGIRIATRSCPLLLTTPDVYSTRMPSLLTRRERFTLVPVMERKAIESANHIIAISEHTKHDICSLFRKASDDVTVVHLGVDASTFTRRDKKEEVDRVRAKYGISGSFVLYVGSLYSRKLGKLLEAFRDVCSVVVPAPDLVIVGGREIYRSNEESLQMRIQRLALTKHVRVTGVIPQSDIPILMSAASAFTFVSMYEGFGLSVLEAMSCGAPVITSNTSSLPEIVGDAGLLVDPSKQSDIAAAIIAVLKNPALEKRLRIAAPRRAALFSWDRTVTETLAVYENVLGGPL